MDFFSSAIQKAQAAIATELTRLAQIPDAMKEIQPAIDSMDN